MKMKLVMALTALVMVTGCATSRSVVSVGAQGSYNNANPAEGVAVKIETVDARTFEMKPPTPDIPSLKDGAITNQATTSRAIGRKRNGYGRALGDILLPEGQTVAQVAGDAIEHGFRQSGYRVLKTGDAGYERAISVSAKIKQYWAWVDIGFWALTLHSRAEVVLTSSLAGLESGLVVESEAQKQSGAAFETDWQDIATKGLTELTSEIAKKLPRQTVAH